MPCSFRRQVRKQQRFLCDGRTHAPLSHLEEALRAASPAAARATAAAAAERHWESSIYLRSMELMQALFAAAACIRVWRQAVAAVCADRQALRVGC